MKNIITETAGPAGLPARLLVKDPELETSPLQNDCFEFYMMDDNLTGGEKETGTRESNNDSSTRINSLDKGNPLCKIRRSMFKYLERRTLKYSLRCWHELRYL